MENVGKAPSSASSAMQDRAIPEVRTLPLEPRRASRMQCCCQAARSSSLLFPHSTLTSTTHLLPEQQLLLPAGVVEKMKAHSQKFGEITVICAFFQEEEGLPVTPS